MEQSERDKQLLAARDEIVKWCRENIIPRLEKHGNNTTIRITFGKMIHNVYHPDHPEYEFEVSSGNIPDCFHKWGHVSVSIIGYQYYSIDAYDDLKNRQFLGGVYGAVEHWDEIKTKLLKEMEKIETFDNKLANFKA